MSTFISSTFEGLVIYFTMEKDENFLKAVSYLPQSISRPLMFLKDTFFIEEIRLRRGLPLALTLRGEIFFCDASGQTSKKIPNNPITVTKEDINNAYISLCNRSVYAHESEIKEGFITTDRGIRVGVCGSYTAKGILREVYSLNIRIPREIKGIAKDYLLGFNSGGILIAGPPASGKTTLLRDIIRTLSQSLKVSVVDTRGEISGGLFNDLGPNSDVIINPDKAKGIEIAVRTMFPEVLAFDEISALDELLGVERGFKSGVRVITTAHISDKNSLLEREITKRIILSGEIERIILMSPQKRGEIIKPKEL